MLAARKAVEQELTKEIIMETARDLFVSEGYQNVTMRKVAKVLGYSHGALYYHFRNKAELFYQLVALDFGLLDQKLEEVMNEAGEPQQKLRNILLGYIEFGVTHPNHYQIMFLIQDDEMQNRLQQEPNRSYEKFASAVHSLCGNKMTPILIWSLFLSLHGFVAHYCKRPEQTYSDLEKLAESHVNFLLKGIE